MHPNDWAQSRRCQHLGQRELECGDMILSTPSWYSRDKLRPRCSKILVVKAPRGLQAEPLDSGCRSSCLQSEDLHPAATIFNYKRKNINVNTYKEIMELIIFNRYDSRF